ncbi:class II aldolase/adducin family protein, partial [Brucella abortus]
MVLHAMPISTRSCANIGTSLHTLPDGHKFGTKNMTEQEIRELIVELGASLFARGYCVGSAGNISVRLADGYLMTPTNSCLGRLR